MVQYESRFTEYLTYGRERDEPKDGTKTQGNGLTIRGEYSDPYNTGKFPDK